jgi:NAD(P)-dependent dehydrogenase (short-subunit alcohol dehydrogenase family)
MSKEQKVIAVTGGSRGIGAAIVHELLTQGWKVINLTRKGLGIEEFELESQYLNQLINLSCDITQTSSIKQAYETIFQLTGRLDALVNNAGIHREEKSHLMDEQMWDEVMNTNAKAVFVSCKEAYPYLIQQPSSVIINIGSFFDKMGVKSNLAYCSSKAAVGAITRCLAVEWASKGIRVLDVAPGYIQTELNQGAMQGPLGEFLAKRIPRKKPGVPQEVATLVATLVQPQMSFLTGETIYVDGAHSIAH